MRGLSWYVSPETGSHSLFGSRFGPVASSKVPMDAILHDSAAVVKVLIDLTFSMYLFVVILCVNFGIILHVAYNSIATMKVARANRIQM